MNSSALHQPATEERPAVPAGLMVAAAVVAVAGAVALAVGLASPAHAPAMWAGLLVNWLYWMGLAQAGVVWAATFRLCGSRWSAPLSRLGDACAAFLPVSFLPGLLIFLGRAHLLPWIGTNVGDRALWVSVPSVFLRDGLGLALLTVLSLAQVRAYRRGGERRPSLTALSIAVLLTYAVVYTFLAFDFVMGLAPFWYSTLMGPYLFCSNLYLGMALLIVAAAALRKRYGPEAPLGPPQWLDAGNLLLAFGMLTTYMFFSQALPIWYGNMPHETSFLVARFHVEPWRTLTWVVIGTAYLGVFLLLVVREVKENPATLRLVAALVLVSMWLERYLLIAPSLLGRHAGFDVLDLLLIAGFAGAFLLSFGWLANRLPKVAALDLAKPEADSSPEVVAREGAGP